MAAVCEVASCGVVAVGRCATCIRAMCTSHRAMVGNNPVADRCTECQRGHDDDRALRSERSRRVHANHVASLAAMPAGVDRLVRSVQYLTSVCAGRTPKTGPLRFEPIIVDFYGDLAQACPDAWPRGGASVDLLHPPWNSTVVAAWFVAQARERGIVPNASLRGWVTTFRSRWHGHHDEQARPLPAWRFFEGSLTHIRVEQPNSTEDRRCDAYVVEADGRVLRAYDTPCELGARALASMGFLLWGRAPKPWEGL